MGGGTVGVKVGSGVGVAISLGSVTATDGVSVIETMAVGASAPGIRRVQALTANRIMMDRRIKNRFMGGSPKYKFLQLHHDEDILSLPGSDSIEFVYKIGCLPVEGTRKL